LKTTRDCLSVVIPVYRDAARAADAARAMCRQRLPAGLELQVIVVDDGSADGTFESLQSLQLPGVELLALPMNQGRSAVRNAGAHTARGDIIVFMDCDCLPVEADFLAAHYAAYQDVSVVAGTGDVTGFDDGFWSRYQARASQRRRLQHARGDVYSGSSQNLSVRKDAFERIGGFDTAYTEYGFEDRDLLLRMVEQGTVAWIDRATVQHRDVLDMRTIVKKMPRAGGTSAEHFSHLHPQAYRKLGYAILDSRLHPAWRLISRPVGWLLPALAASFQGCLSIRLLPFPIAAAGAKTLTGLAFMTGTCKTKLMAPREDNQSRQPGV
jgi:glycosyltransferase involved in cell wall biosynthesis